MDTKLISGFFISGFYLGLWPCLVHCSAVLMPYIAGTCNGWKEGLVGSIGFSLGRLIAYVLLGALSGLSGSIISSMYMTGNFTLYLKVAGSIILLVIGIAVMAGSEKSILCGLIDRNRIKSTVLLGIITGLLPCLPMMGILVYMVLKSNNVIDGIIYGFAFGAGTVVSPVLLAGALAGYLSKKVEASMKYYRWMKIICGIIIIIFSIKMLIGLLITK